jgi:hypothetical protein
MKEIIIWVIVTGGVLFGMHSCDNSDWHKQHEKELQQTRIRNETPHVVREVDGCKVYAFMIDDRYHYFTRCKAETTTESDHVEQCGKNCQKVITESIPTEYGSH